MQLITHQKQIDLLPPSTLKDHIQRRSNQYTESPGEIPPVFILIEFLADLSSLDLQILGSAGICSDLFDTHTPKDKGFQTIFDWISFLPDLNLYEMLYIEGDLGYWVICPDDIVESDLDLKIMISSQKLSNPQPYI